MHEVFESAARYFSVLGEPTRLRILHTLCQDEKCVNDIIRNTGLAQANVSRHLGLMYQAGLLSRRREGTQIHYRVADPVYLELCRTVVQQVCGPQGAVPRPFSPVSSSTGATPHPQAPVHPHTPANQKEKASV